MRTSDGDMAPLVEALAKARGAIGTVAKHRKANVGKYSYAYADISDILTEVVPHLLGAGLMLTQEAATVEGGVAITTRLWHASGAWIETDPLVMPCAKDAQQVGSAITYGRRYSLGALLGIATDDDDDARSAHAGGPDNSRQRVAGKLGGQRQPERRSAAEPDPPVTPEALDELRRLVEETSTHERKITQHYGVAGLADLTMRQAVQATERLKERLNNERNH